MVSFILLNYLRFFLVPVLVVHILYFRWYAKRFLHPDVVASYEYIFVWDEDLGLEHFNAERCVLSTSYILQLNFNMRTCMFQFLTNFSL